MDPATGEEVVQELGDVFWNKLLRDTDQARFENPDGNQEEWMEESLDETGNNVAMSAFTDFIGFMVLALSIMPLFVTFGLIMAVMIFLSFVAAVIMLPALLYQFGNLEGKSNY